MKPPLGLPIWGCAFVVALAAWFDSATATPPTYTQYQIQARTNFAVNPGGAYNIPADYFFSGEDIKVNDVRQVSFHISVAGSNDFQSVWFGQNGAGGIVYNSESGASLG